ncbi:MAG: hypothetical protein LBK52_05685 [Deltaproteobacteria bacterium]|jgi:hypothetical protein|nr:hypothetical protein [Deltaproteobacteria bacterium]
MIKIIVFTVCILFVTVRAEAWQLQNLSDEPRIFDEFHPGYRTPYTKTARPKGGSLNFPNQPRVSIMDRKTGQKIDNPGFKSMVVTKEGYVMFR